MNVIFLDIDGVLNSKQFVRSLGNKWDGNQFDPKAIECLNRLVIETNADVVISSFWRMIHSLDELKIIFLNYGLNSNIIGKTKVLCGDRAAEIIDWYNDHKPDRFVIIDDDFLTIDESKQLDPFLKTRFVRTSSNVGLQNSDVDLAIQILNTGFLMAG